MLKEKTLNRYQLDKAIKKYHDNMCKYMRMKDELDSLTTAASTAKYGIEATMPKAVGSTSDPVHVLKLRLSLYKIMPAINNQLVKISQDPYKLSRIIDGLTKFIAYLNLFF